MSAKSTSRTGRAPRPDSFDPSSRMRRTERTPDSRPVERRELVRSVLIVLGVAVGAFALFALYALVMVLMV